MTDAGYERLRRLAARHPGYAGFLRPGDRPAAAPADPHPCYHLGDALPPKPGDPLRRWSLCDHPARPLGPEVCPCRGCGPACPGYRPDTPEGDAAAAGPLLRRARVDSSTLNPGVIDARFNAGLIRFKGRLLLAYRTGWEGAEVHVAELTEDYRAVRNEILVPLRHPQAPYGREDPRLFVFRGRLHVAYIGVMSGNGPTNQMYARLSDDGRRVEETFYPHYQRRRAWEKNWAFFEWEDELFCVYQVRPHVVLHVRGNEAYPFVETDTPHHWTGGELRGGAPPVRVGDRYYHWFHGRVGEWQHGVYTVGVYTFRARPPFDVLGMTADPLLSGERLPEYGDRGYEPRVVFPCGAFLEAGRWKVSMGVEDRVIDVCEWDAAACDRLLAPAPGAAAPPPPRKGFALAVPAYQNLPGLTRLLDSVAAGTARPDEVLVVDNGGDVPDRAWPYPFPVRVVRPGRNLGVAAAWNLVRGTAEADDLVIASDDVEVGPETLARMIAAPPAAGAVFLRDPSSGWPAGYSLFLLRRWLSDRIGPFDEGFHPAYFEDADFTRRFEVSGLPPETFHLVEAPATHHTAGRGHLPWVAEGAARNRERFRAKWGYDPADPNDRREKFARPWDGADPPPG